VEKGRIDSAREDHLLYTWVYGTVCVRTADVGEYLVNLKALQ
jgi:hypothetical protein